MTKKYPIFRYASISRTYSGRSVGNSFKLEPIGASRASRESVEPSRNEWQASREPVEVRRKSVEVCRKSAKVR